MQIGSDNTNMIRSVCNHCKNDNYSIRFKMSNEIAQLFDSMRFEMKKTIRTALFHHHHIRSLTQLVTHDASTSTIM